MRAQRGFFRGTEEQRRQVVLIHQVSILAAAATGNAFRVVSVVDLAVIVDWIGSIGEKRGSRLQTDAATTEDVDS